MKISSALTLTATALMVACSTTPPTPASPAGSAGAAPLIPRSAIFGNPERAAAEISPDGKYIAFLAPRDGVLNVWVVERGRPFSAARPLTHEKVRPVRGYSWAANARDILYVQDSGGDEN